MKPTADMLVPLIDAVYEAAVDDAGWLELAPRIAGAFASTSTTLQVQRSRASFQILSMTANVASGISAYTDYFWQRDIWVQRAVERLGMAQVGSSNDMIGDAEFAQTEFYRDWCRHLDVFYVVGAVFPSGPGKLGVLGIHRPRQAGTYDESDKVLVRQFLPHLQRALRIRECLGEAALHRSVSLETLKRCKLAVLLVAADGLIVFANKDAELMLFQGAVIRSCNGRLTTRDARETDRLIGLIRDACGANRHVSTEGVMSLHCADRRPLGILVAPSRASLAGYPAGLAMVFIRDPSRSLTALAALHALFGLTPTEARIAQALAKGATAEAIASEHDAKVATVRKQIKSILVKTGTSRQGECVATILSSIAALAGK